MVPKPAHRDSGCKSWLQSMWTVGRHLSQYLSAVDAFAAPDTCKQLTPQITAVWAVQCSEVQTNCSLPIHLQTSQGPLHSNLAANPSVRRTLPTSGLYSIPSRLTTAFNLREGVHISEIRLNAWSPTQLKSKCEAAVAAGGSAASGPRGRSPPENVRILH